MASVAQIGAIADLNEDESELGAGEPRDDYITVEFSLFAELDDGRRVETTAVYSEGGPRIGWGVLEGRAADRPVSRSSMEDLLRQRVWPGTTGDQVWLGVVRRLERLGIATSIDDLFAAPFRFEIEPRLQAVVGD